MRAHKLKTWPEPFIAVEAGRKTCELRRADRDFKVGDGLMLVEFDPQRDTLTGRYVCRKITHILTGDVVPRALLDGYVVLSIEPADRFDEEAMLGGENIINSKVEWLKPLAIA